MIIRFIQQKLWTKNYEYFQIGPHAATLQSWHRSPKNSAIAQSIGSVYTTYSKPGGMNQETALCYK